MYSVHSKNVEVSATYCFAHDKATKQDLGLDFQGIFIYHLFWTQACPEGMCTNGTQVPCEVPSLPSPTTRKGWPHHRGIRPLLFSNNDVGSFTSHKNKSVKVLCDGTYGLSSLSEKTRKSNHLQMSFQRQHPERWSGRSLNPGPPARQTGALPFELTRRRLNLATHTLRSSILLF